jgi:hypothetical protein
MSSNQKLKLQANRDSESDSESNNENDESITDNEQSFTNSLKCIETTIENEESIPYSRQNHTLDISQLGYPASLTQVLTADKEHWTGTYSFFLKPNQVVSDKVTVTISIHADQQSALDIADEFISRAPKKPLMNKL